MTCQDFTRYVISDINHKSSLISIPIYPVWDRETVYANQNTSAMNHQIKFVTIMILNRTLAINLNSSNSDEKEFT